MYERVLTNYLRTKLLVYVQLVYIIYIEWWHYGTLSRGIKLKEEHLSVGKTEDPTRVTYLYYE